MPQVVKDTLREIFRGKVGYFVFIIIVIGLSWAMGAIYGIKDAKFVDKNDLKAWHLWIYDGFLDTFIILILSNEAQ